MGIRHTFFAYGILAIFALALVLIFTSTQIDTTNSQFYNIAVLMVLFFFLLTLVRVFKR